MLTNIGKKGRKLILLGAGLLCFILLINAVSLSFKIRAEERKLEKINEQINAAREINDELSRLLAGTEGEYVERIAREELGYAAVGERVYEDISGTE